ncbi:hypothetical protein QYF36_022051 [Acer negundo]|nr:hypothetical protein QYF36_022051 [Acer negundo]
MRVEGHEVVCSVAGEEQEGESKRYKRGNGELGDTIGLVSPPQSPTSNPPPVFTQTQHDHSLIASLQTDHTKQNSMLPTLSPTKPTSPISNSSSVFTQTQHDHSPITSPPTDYTEQNFLLSTLSPTKPISPISLVASPYFFCL